MFRPRFSGYETRDEIEHVLSAIKSLIELVALKERYQALQTSPQFDSVYLLFSKVAEDSCKWVRTIAKYTTINDNICVHNIIASRNN